MNIEAIRTALYPFGFLSSIAFGFRFLLQWYRSEQAGASIVPKAFWQLSFTGNALLFLHTLIQVQFPMCILQSFHMVLSWRNLNLMGKNPCHIKRVFFLLGLGAAITPLLFLLQSALLSTSTTWIRVPISSLQIGAVEATPLLHLIGIIGVAAFSLRFWIQWWQAESQQQSVLSPTFWWLSLFGALLASFYFYKIQDWVNIIGPCLAIIPYTRNLQLIFSSRLKNSASNSIANSVKKIDLFVICGEPSGDILAAAAIAQLQQHNPQLKVAGVTGPQLRDMGVETIFPMECLRVMGFTAVLKALPRIVKLRRNLVRAIVAQQNTPVLFIDQPSFSLNVGNKLKKHGYKGQLVQLVAPSVWAWGETRVHEYARIFSKLFTLFKFEERYFSPHMPCRWIGFPTAVTLQGLKSHPNPDRVPATTKEYISLFPGSRPFEIAANLKLQLKALQPLLQQDPSLKVAVALAPTIENIAIPAYVTLFPPERRYELMQKTRLALAKSGTVTLELALLNVPTVVTYALNPLNYFFARFWINPKVRYFSLPNILTNCEICKEHIRPPIRIKEITASCRSYLYGNQPSTDYQENSTKLWNEVLPHHSPTESLVEELQLLIQHASVA